MHSRTHQWTTDSTKFVPVMSGGLLALSTQWWRETGGYDKDMLGWGGENLDQSLRIWLCGGEIVSAPTSYVAHMWRDGSKPKTAARYRVPPGAPAKNRARAAKAHMGAFFAKTLTFPAFGSYQADQGKGLDVADIEGVKEKLGTCKPFEWYLRKFDYIYKAAGLLPAHIFELEADESGQCLALGAHQSWGNANAPDDTLVMRPCKDDPDVDGQQWWHGSNRGGSGRCCTGFRNWNSDQCIESHGPGNLRSSVCDLDSSNRGQAVALSDAGALQFGTAGGRGHCLKYEAATKAVVSAPCSETSTVWHMREKKRPMEYELLSPEMQKFWDQ